MRKYKFLGHSSISVSQASSWCAVSLNFFNNFYPFINFLIRMVVMNLCLYYSWTGFISSSSKMLFFGEQPKFYRIWEKLGGLLVEFYQRIAYYIDQLNLKRLVV